MTTFKVTLLIPVNLDQDDPPQDWDWKCGVELDNAVLVSSEEVVDQ